jgi:alanine-synthesizing transaminase
VFSSRLPSTLAANTFSAAIAALRRQGVVLADLTTSNPTKVGLAYPAHLLAPLGDVQGVSYDPQPFGLRSARQAVADHLAADGAATDPEQVVLTASTSEAYSLLFKLLCDPGDTVLTPEPSYPLFELLTRLDSVVSAPYQLEHHGFWSIDRESVAAAAAAGRARAILVVSPNNPTGSMLRSTDREWLVAFAFERNLALISDEVFSGYPIEPRPDASSLMGEDRVLTFTLGGLSKSAGLPQVKLGWIVVSGPAGQVSDALQRLEMICDTYLSVSTPVQVAAASLIAGGADIQRQILDRVHANYHALTAVCARYPSVRLLSAEGGWCAVLRVPSTIGDEALALRILTEAHVLVHPGYFFDIHHGTHLVVSLLPEPDLFTTAIAQVLEIAV